MSDLEKYIIENREEFSSDEPDTGHFDRFSKKMQAGKRPAMKVRFRHILQIAASIAILLSSGIVIVKSSKGKSKMAIIEVPAQYQETQNYYTHQVNSRYNEIESMNFSEEEEKEMLLKELQEMDIYYQDLLVDLNANPGDERVISALIKHYQMKMLVMDQIIDQLKQFNQTKSENNEKSSV
jgi:hypothetical protein